MPRVTPVASKADVAPEHQAVVDDVLKVFGAVRDPTSALHLLADIGRLSRDVGEVPGTEVSCG
jgi:hypothetical protein